MGKIADATFEGASGQKYDFGVYSTDTAFKDVGAVYIFSRRTKNPDRPGTHELLYVGATEELGTRVADHEKWPCVLGNGGNAICVHLEADTMSRLNKETDLRHVGESPCNDQ